MTYFGLLSAVSYVNTGFALTVGCRLGCACSFTLAQPYDGVTIHLEVLVRPGVDLKCSTENYVSLVVIDGVDWG